MATILNIDEAAKQRATEIIAYAAKHPYFMGVVPRPIDVPNYVGVFERGFKTIFSFTLLEGKTFRHLTVATDSGRAPPPFAVLALADLFGFVGRGESGGLDIPDDWMLKKCECCNNVMVAQVVPPAPASSSRIH